MKFNLLRCTPRVSFLKFPSEYRLPGENHKLCPSSACPEKPWPWRIRRCVKLANSTVWSWSHHFWSFRVCGDFHLWISRFWSNPLTSKAAMSAPNSRVNKLDAPFDAPGSELSSALRINIVRQTIERMEHFVWKSRLKTTKNCDAAHDTPATSPILPYFVEIWKMAEKRVFVALRRATQRWKCQGPNFWAVHIMSHL